MHLIPGAFEAVWHLQRQASIIAIQHICEIMIEKISYRKNDGGSRTLPNYSSAALRGYAYKIKLKGNTRRLVTLRLVIIVKPIT